VTDAFLYYTRPGGIFQLEKRSINAKNVFTVYFFAALFSLSGSNALALARTEVLALCNHETRGSDLMRHALMLSLYHGRTEANEMLIQGLLKRWKRPEKEIVRLQIAEQRHAEREAKAGQQLARTPLDPNFQPGLLRRPVDVGDLKRLWVVFGNIMTVVVVVLYNRTTTHHTPIYICQVQLVKMQ
jgi:hypothetical protein